MSKGQTTQPSCWCHSGKIASECCAPIIDDPSVAATPEALMRSRYSAYVLGDKQHLLRTWHHSTRPVTLDLEEQQHWIGLKIYAATDDEVEFAARFKIAGKRHRLRERSRFVREAGQWFYIDGLIGEKVDVK